MLATGYKTVTVTLELNELEALWLKSMVQNPLCGSESESQTDETMRQVLFNALTEAGVE